MNQDSFQLPKSVTPTFIKSHYLGRQIKSADITTCQASTTAHHRRVSKCVFAGLPSVQVGGGKVANGAVLQSLGSCDPRSLSHRAGSCVIYYTDHNTVHGPLTPE
jgi:hypothetical protein